MLKKPAAGAVRRLCALRRGRSRKPDAHESALDDHFDPPSLVVEAVREEFGLSVVPQIVEGHVRRNRRAGRRQRHFLRSRRGEGGVTDRAAGTGATRDHDHAPPPPHRTAISARGGMRHIRISAREEEEVVNRSEPSLIPD
jgi:hypothetical protein